MSETPPFLDISIYKGYTAFFRSQSIGRADDEKEMCRMNILIRILKAPLFHAALIGAFGGMAPKMIEMIPRLFNNVFPSAGHIAGLALLAMIGGVIVLVYKEVNLQKALILGAGAPAILASFTAQAIAPSSASAWEPFSFSFASTAYAQPAERSSTAIFVFTKNESPYRLNALWIRADGMTIQKYFVKEDTVIVPLPPGIREVRIDLSPEGERFVLPVSDVQHSSVMKLNIVNNQRAKDFWETFGGKTIPQFRIEREP